MREKMEAMQEQMEGFIRTLNQELSERAGQRPAEAAHSLVPVIEISSLAARGEAKRGQEVKRRK